MYYIGLDIGGTFIKAGLVNENGDIIKHSSIETKATRKAERVIEDMVAQIRELAAGAEFESVGIGCPGSIYSETGTVEYSNNLYWRKVPLGEMLKAELKKPVFVSNDANVAALGEAKFGAGKGYSDVIMITLGTGVGMGIVVDGKMFEGYRSMGGEGGHIVIRENGVRCTCGRRGCLEAYASATALIRETLNAMMIDKNSLMWEFCANDLNKVDGKTSFECAKRGDITAQKVVDDYIKALSEGVINVINIFRSQAIIIGGGVSAQGAYLTHPIQQYVDKYRYGGRESLPVKILTASLGNDAGILGAASLGFRA